MINKTKREAVKKLAERRYNKQIEMQEADGEINRIGEAVVEFKTQSLKAELASIELNRYLVIDAFVVFFCFLTIAFVYIVFAV